MSADSTFERRLASVGLWLGPVLALAVLFFTDLGDPVRTRTAAVAVLMAVWWLTTAIPLAVTALVPLVAFPVLGVMPGKAVAGDYVNWIIFLFIGGFLVALAMERWNLHRRLALRVLLAVGGRPSAILFGFMAATAFLSMWISNTATTMMMVPIGIAIMTNLDQIAGREHTRVLGTSLLLGIAYSASIGGISTLVGTPPNMSLVGIYEAQVSTESPFSFSRWMVFALPLSLLLFGITWAYLAWPMRKTEQSLRVDKSILEEHYRKLGPMQYEEKWVLAVFVSMAVAWIFRKDLELPGITIPGWSRIPLPNTSYIDDGTVAMAFALILFLIPAREKEKAGRLLDIDVFKKLPWGIVLLFGGGFALAAAFQESGLSQWVGEQLQVLAGLPPVLVVAGICVIITFLTEITSNTATAQVLLPILAALAIEIDVDPLMLMVPGAISCSFAFMLPVATPPNAIVYASDRVTTTEMARTGFVLNMIGVFLTTAAVFLWGRSVLGF